MEVDEVTPGMQPSSKETDGGFLMCEVEEHVSKSKARKEE